MPKVDLTAWKKNYVEWPMFTIKLDSFNYSKNKIKLVFQCCVTNLQVAKEFDHAKKKGFYLVKPKVDSTTHKNKIETKVHLMLNEPSFGTKG